MVSKLELKDQEPIRKNRRGLRDKGTGVLLETREHECWSWGGCWRKLLERLKLTKHYRERSRS